MLPLRDSIPNIHRPVAMYGIMLANLLVLLWHMSLDPHQQEAVFYSLGVVPKTLLADPGAHLMAVITHMFMHGGFLHFFMNMWVMWIFGDNVEDVMGPGRFLLFYVLCGLAALAGHLFFNATSTVPVVGASGAIAGVMGAYLMLYPHGRVRVMIPIFIIPYATEVPAALFLIIWFAIQLLSGFSAAGAGQQGGVAFMAHAAGFIAGIALLPIFRRPDRPHYIYDSRTGRYELASLPGQDRFPHL